MPSSTPALTLPYPLSSDADDVPGDIKSLATRVETLLGQVFLHGNAVLTTDASSNYLISVPATQFLLSQTIVQCTVVDAFGNQRVAVVTSFGTGVIFLGSTSFTPRTTDGTAITSGTVIYWRLLSMP